MPRECALSRQQSNRGMRAGPSFSAYVQANLRPATSDLSEVLHNFLFGGATEGVFEFCRAVPTASPTHALHGCAGSNVHGQLGVPGTSELSDPKLIQGDGRWAALAFSGKHAAGLTGDGQLYTWGRNTHGQLGHGEACESLDVPARVASADDAEFRCGMLQRMQPCMHTTAHMHANACACQGMAGNHGYTGDAACMQTMHGWLCDAAVQRLQALGQVQALHHARGIACWYTWRSRQVRHVWMAGWLHAQ